MSDVLETRVVLHAWLLLHHVMLFRCTSRFSAVLVTALIVFIVVATLVREVLWAFVFVRAAILFKPSVSKPMVPIVSRNTHVLEPRNGLVDVARRVLVKLLVMAKDNNRDVDRAEHRQLMRLLEQTALALEESDGPGRRSALAGCACSIAAGRVSAAAATK